MFFFRKRYCTYISKYWTSHVLQGTRKTRPCSSGHPVYSLKHWQLTCCRGWRTVCWRVWTRWWGSTRPSSPSSSTSCSAPCPTYPWAPSQSSGRAQQTYSFGRKKGGGAGWKQDSVAWRKQRRINVGGHQIITPRMSFLADIFYPLADNFDNLADNFDHLGSKMSARKLLRGVMIWCPPRFFHRRAALDVSVHK